MKPTITTPDTLILGMWVEAGRAAVVGSVRKLDNFVEPDVVQATGMAWAALAEALSDARTMAVRNVVIVTNDSGIVAALSRKPNTWNRGMRVMVGLPSPTPTERQRVFLNRTDGSIDVQWGGDTAHWDALRILGGDFGGHWSIYQSDNLPKARALWQSTQ